MKIGRNDICPCGSGLKYKKCCMATRAAAGPTVAKPRTLRAEIASIQAEAAAGREAVREFGVFIFFSSLSGDAWLLEISGKDALHLAADREPLEFQLTENSETIEVNWSHTFAVRDKRFVVTPYKEGKEQVFAGYPSHAIAAAIKRIKKKFSPQHLERVHVEGA